MPLLEPLLLDELLLDDPPLEPLLELLLDDPLPDELLDDPPLELLPEDEPPSSSPKPPLPVLLLLEHPTTTAIAVTNITDRRILPPRAREYVRRPPARQPAHIRRRWAPVGCEATIERQGPRFELGGPRRPPSSLARTPARFVRIWATA
jgi:hypothetical protein